MRNRVRVAIAVPVVAWVGLVGTAAFGGIAYQGSDWSNGAQDGTRVRVSDEEPDGRGVHADAYNQAGSFVHFTGRPLGNVAPAPAAHTGTAEDRLRSILAEGRVRAYRTFESPPVVCVCEVTRPAANALLETGVTHRGPYKPWGVVLSRQSCIDSGARPVLHLSAAEISRLKSQKGVEPPMHWRAVRYDPPDADWTHEREWRFGFRDNGHDLGVGLHRLITGIIVGRLGWVPDKPAPWAVGLTLKRYAWTGGKLVDDGTWSPT